MSTKTFTRTESPSLERLTALLGPSERPPNAGPVAASLAFAWRGILKVKHVPEQLSDVILIPVTFTLMFTYIFGGALAGSVHDYLQFLLPGTLVMSVLLMTMYTGITLNTDIGSGVSDRFRSLPVWQPAAIVGGLLGDIGRYLIATGIVLVLGLALGFRPDGGLAGVAGAVAVVLVFALALSWVWTVLGMVLRTPQSIQTVAIVALFPLTMASNVFVQPETMPGWLRGLVNANPVSHLVTASRGLMSGSWPGGEIAYVLAASALLMAVFAPLTLRLYARKR